MELILGRGKFVTNRKSRSYIHYLKFEEGEGVKISWKHFVIFFLQFQKCLFQL